MIANARNEKDGAQMGWCSPAKLQYRLQLGLSLLELLVAMAVVGIISCVSVPPAMAFCKRLEPTQGQRNAQRIVDVYLTGAIDGVNWDISSRDATLHDVLKGRKSLSARSDGHLYVVKDLTDEEVDRAVPYIGSNILGSLYYDKSGDQPPDQYAD